MIKKTFILTVLLVQSVLLLSQEKEASEFLDANDTWGLEEFIFPISFAREIDYQGTEDALFPTGWGDTTSTNFFTYAFGWEIEVTKALSIVDFETNLQYYFDGLLGLTSPRKDLPQATKTNALFIENKPLDGNRQYTGKIKTFETRFRNVPMTLYVQAEQHFCAEHNKSFILFKFSPQAFKTAAWHKLDEVKLHKDICEK